MILINPDTPPAGKKSRFPLTSIILRRLTDLHFCIIKLTTMQTLQQTINPAYLVSKTKKQSLFTRFINWANGQEPFRYGWLGVILAAHGCFLTPATVFVVLYSGNNIWMFVTAVTVMAMSLV